ncbi:MAG: 23S rRNA (guanosine(2251)-2'-O)-methyltransferase RlmB [Chromatiaceae bacterium]|jgi:23S rRNA (guanosine2251-2'-O)-methyltransferase
MARQRAFGIHAVRAALGHGRERVSRLLYDPERADRRLRQLLEAARAIGVRPEPVDKARLDQLCGGGNHQGVLVEGDAPASGDEQGLDALLDAIPHVPLLLVLDGVTDPHNLGACLRSADGAGADAVIAPRDRASGLTPTACKVASGAAESVPFFQVTNLARSLRHLQDRHRVFVVGLAGEAQTGLYAADLTGPVALVCGAEGGGLRRLTRDTCDQLVRLPMAGQVDSLNVAVAAGVCLYEAVRQRAGVDGSAS